MLGLSWIGGNWKSLQFLVSCPAPHRRAVSCVSCWFQSAFKKAQVSWDQTHENTGLHHEPEKNVQTEPLKYPYPISLYYISIYIVG